MHFINGTIACSLICILNSKHEKGITERENTKKLPPPYKKWKSNHPES